MKALLLAAGLGTRLKPITDTIPKCLVPIHGKPLLEYWLENLSEVGVNEFLINISYLSEQIEEFIQNSKYRDVVTLVHEKKLLNTGGTLLANRNFFDKEPFMLVHADNICICDFNEFIKSHERASKDITMMLFKSDNPSSCGIVKLDDNGIVEEFYEKVKNPPSNLANGAVYICSSTIFNFLKSLEKVEIDFSNDVLPKYIGNINTYLNNIYHRDIGSVESYAKSNIEFYKLIKKK
ncbi:MAG: nucleotidyltransferase family protein [Sulfurimonas sp.]|nr:nucleotidyltransferase family protein [Sulfurimonas sp.]